LIDDVVIRRVDRPYQLELFRVRVETVSLGEHAEYSGRLVILFAVLYPNRDLASGHSGFQGTPFFKSDSLVFVLNLGVVKKHSDWFCTSVDTEVD